MKFKRTKVAMAIEFILQYNREIAAIEAGTD